MPSFLLLHIHIILILKYIKRPPSHHVMLLYIGFQRWPLCIGKTIAELFPEGDHFFMFSIFIACTSLHRIEIKWATFFMETYNVYISAYKKSKLNHHILNHSVFPKGHKLIHFPVVDMRNLFEFLGRLSIRIPKPS